MELLNSTHQMILIGTNKKTYNFIKLVLTVGVTVLLQYILHGIGEISRIVVFLFDSASRIPFAESKRKTTQN